MRARAGVPVASVGLPNHVWKPLVEKAGFKMEEIPKTWDAYYDFFKEVQKKLKAQGMRNVYGVGWQLTTNGNDPNNVFNYLLIAYGGQYATTQVRRFAPYTLALQRTFGAAVLLVALAFYTQYDSIVAVWFSALYPNLQLGL